MLLMQDFGVRGLGGLRVYRLSKFKVWELEEGLNGMQGFFSCLPVTAELGYIMVKGS